MIYTGECHCGGIVFSFESDKPEELIKCNCSLCRKRNAVMLTTFREKFRIDRGRELLSLYRWNSGVALHYFCSNCGIYIYHQRRSDPAFLSVNVFCVNALEIDILPIRVVDGKSRSLIVKKK